MKKTIKVAVTGGMGSGKSSVCQHFKSLGFPFISADEQAAKALKKDSSIYPDILKLFPHNPKLKPQQIAEEIFSKPSLKKSFEEIIHPYIFQCIKDEERYLLEKNHQIIFYEIPLLFETNMSYYFDYIILITCPKNMRVKRVKEQMNISEDQILKRISTQIQHDANQAHFIIDNSKSFKELEKSAEDILSQVRSTCSI